MTRRQWGYTILIMLLFVIPLVEITKWIIQYSVAPIREVGNYQYAVMAVSNEGFSYWRIVEIVVYWLCWLMVIPIARRVSR